jgi:hypothetical protein
MVVVDHRTKRAHFIPHNKSIIGEKIIKLFLDHVFRYHRFLEDIVFYCGPQFTSKFWKWLFELLGVKVKLSSIFHPQTVGQMKRVNQILEQYLQCMTNYHQDNWWDLLSIAEFFYNNIMHSTTQQTPLFANHGLHLKFNIQGVTNIMNLANED